MSFNSVLHVGAGKCGSSTLQRCLTLKPHYRSDNGISYEYMALKEQGELVRSTGFSRYMRHDTDEGVMSRDLNRINLAAGEINGLSESMRAVIEQDICPIFSCEGWMSAVHQFEATEILNRLGLKPKIVIFVRPPLDWINSSWWQWGAWSEFTLDDWVKRSVKVVNWCEWGQRWQRLSNVHSVSICLATRDVVQSFADLLDIEIHKAENRNRSSSAAVLRYMQRNREFRRSPHDNRKEKMLNMALQTLADKADSNSRQYQELLQGKTPWVLTVEHQKYVMEQLGEQTRQVRDYLGKDDQQYFDADLRWFSRDPYSDRIVEPELISTEQPEDALIKSVIDNMESGTSSRWLSRLSTAVFRRQSISV